MNPCAIFLDVDGVLNSMRSLVAFGSFKPDALDPAAIRLVDRLARELRKSGYAPQVVISSTWRMLFPSPGWWNELFAQHGARDLLVVGMTPQLSMAEARRGHEVADWLRAFDPMPYVCLDDDSDFLPDQPLVLTRFERGLEPDHIVEAFRLITGKEMPGVPKIFGALAELDARAALVKIATGGGVYGAQALEYKNIARAALGMQAL